MARTRPLRLAPEWDDRFTRMVIVSAAIHAMAIGSLIALAPLIKAQPLPLVAYTVELTDPNALGGRLPPGAPARDLSGGQTEPAPPAPKPEPPKPPEPEQTAKVEPPPKPVEPPKAPEPKPPEPKPEEAVKIPEKPKPPEPKPPEPKPPAKPPEPKPEVKKPEPKPPEPRAPEAKKPEPPKPETKPAAPARGGTGGPAEAPRDAYATAADRWRTRPGGGLGGTEGGSGPIGAGGEGKGGGGQLVGLEFLAYRQRVIDSVKSQWVNVIGRAGLVARVRFEIAADGSVSAVRLEQSSGNAGYDTSALRAVERANPLPPPPARYANDFHDFVIEFHSEEPGGQGTG
jgi:colicin import membrane protein